MIKKVARDICEVIGEVRKSTRAIDEGGNFIRMKVNIDISLPYAHVDKNCELWIRSKGSLTSDQQQYGPSLRAAPYQSTSKDVIFVSGYYEN